MLGLRTIEDISALILHSHDLQETLDNIVTLVARRLHSDVCSIYLLDEDGETLRLHATRGLSRGARGITMKVSEGLTGLAVEERRVVATDNAPLHPRFKYFREAKEEKVRSFLGVPLFDRNVPVGVLVVQTKEARTFSKEEVSAASTIAWQISSVVVNAKLLDKVRKKEEERAFFASELARLRPSGEDGHAESSQAMLKGHAVSPGFCTGRVTVLSRDARDAAVVERVRPRPEELKRFQLALETARVQTIYMERRMAEILSKEDAAIFHSHLMILEDRGFIGKITALIDEDLGARRAVTEVVGQYVAAFSAMEDPYLRERSHDIEDIGRRIVDALDGNHNRHEKLKENRVLVASELFPSDMAVMEHGKVLGIVTERGNLNSHAAIVARSLGIPTIFGVEGVMKAVGSRSEVIVDGTSGSLYVNPEARIKREYERLQRQYSQKQRALEGLRDLPAVTLDGRRVTLLANIGLLNDVPVARANGAEGVGLYRTEFPFMARKAFPGRQEQYLVYRKILEGFPGLPVSIRTLDIGGDKELGYFPHPKEDNPFMGWRSIRVSLDRQDIFREQLAGILLASPYGKCRVMFPLISAWDEVQTIKRIVAEVREELTAQGKPFDPGIEMGIMVELPAAVQIAEHLVREVDYFSIGTNDLIQYTLACDRNNARMKRWYDPYHPAVLASIKRVADVGNAAGKPVTVCGEMAGEPVNALLLLGLGVTSLSMSAPSIPQVKEAIRRVTYDEAKGIADRVLGMASGPAIRKFLEGVQREKGL